MVNITLFEIHLDEAVFEANAPFAGESDEEAAESAIGTEAEPTSDEGDGPPAVVPLVMGLVVLVALAAILRKLRGGDDEDDFDEGEGVDTVDVETP